MRHLALLATAAGLLLAPMPRPSTSRRLATAPSTAPDTPSNVDVAVIGAGPAGTVMAWALTTLQGLSVALIDPQIDGAWPNNYGVWECEWQALQETLGTPLDQCVDTRWEVTDCYFGGSHGMPTNQRSRLAREYCRVDRTALQSLLRSETDATMLCRRVGRKLEAKRTEAANVFADGLVHDAEGTTLTLTSPGSASPSTLRCRTVVDCTGHESKLVAREGAAESGLWRPPPSPGYQIAYGFTAAKE